jgi:predicted lipoprotein with Yx(FWY)xxD motif
MTNLENPMRTSRIAVFAALSVAVFGSQAFADGKVLTNSATMTVYTFDKDSAGKSACVDQCLAIWPVVTPEAIKAGPDIGAITRDDGSKQATFKSKPLYLFAADEKPGDTKGDGVKGVWHVVPLDGAAKASSGQTGYSNSGSGYSFGY